HQTEQAGQILSGLARRSGRAVPALDLTDRGPQLQPTRLRLHRQVPGEGLSGHLRLGPWPRRELVQVLAHRFSFEGLVRHLGGAGRCGVNSEYATNSTNATADRTVITGGSSDGAPGNATRPQTAAPAHHTDPTHPDAESGTHAARTAPRASTRPSRDITRRRVVLRQRLRGPPTPPRGEAPSPPVHTPDARALHPRPQLLQ